MMKNQKVNHLLIDKALRYAMLLLKRFRCNLISEMGLRLRSILNYLVTYKQL